MRQPLKCLVAGVCAVAAAVFTDGAQARGVSQADDRLSIVLLVDVTMSVTETMAVLVSNESNRSVKMPESPRDAFLAPITQQFIQRLRPTDRVRLGRIAGRTALSGGFTSDPRSLAQDARQLLDVPRNERYGPTPLWDAVDTAVTALASEPGRQAVILMTDGLATGNRLGVDEVIARARRANVSVSVVFEKYGPGLLRCSGNDHSNPPCPHFLSKFGKLPEESLHRLTSGTGGVLAVDGDGGKRANPGPHLSGILDALHNR